MKPRVFHSFPSTGDCRTKALVSHAYHATLGKCDLMPGFVDSGVLPHGFNGLWCQALNLYKAGQIDYWMLHHADIEILTRGWLDVMVEDMERTQAKVLSANVPIKDDSGDTSTAIETDDIWLPRKLTLEECHRFGETFGIQDTDWPRSTLLVNTGVMLVRLDCPEWLEFTQTVTTNGCECRVLPMPFQFQTRIIEQPNGQLAPQFISEDWDFSRAAARAGLKVMATNKIEVTHHGWRGHGNQLQEDASV